VLEEAPQSLVFLTRVEDPTRRAEIQRDLVLRYPNISAIDLETILAAIDAILSKVALAIRFMALFSIGSGLVILVGAIATSRYQRMRESVLLKTLGARSRQVRRILLTEYFALGALGGLVGAALAWGAGWAASEFLFEIPYRPPTLRLAGFWLGTAVLTTVVGVLAGRDALRRPPLEVMRELSE
jgi:putative ABC transport system permease protein